MNAKVTITLEMVVLWTATILLYKKKHPRALWADILVFIGLPSAFATGILLALLTIPVDISGAQWPALFGGLIAGSAILYEGQAAVTVIDQVLEKIQGLENVNLEPTTGGTPPTKR